MPKCRDLWCCGLQVAFASLIFFGLIDTFAPRMYGIESVGMVHSLIAGAMTLWAVLENHVKDVDWPQLCDDSPHLVASMLPMITCGYAVFDVIVGLRSNRVDYFMHGIVLFLVCGTACFYGVSALMTYG